MHPRLALRLLRLFAAGAIAATEVQALAADAWADGWGRDSDLAKRLARAGGPARHTGNMARDILKAAELAGLMRTAQPYMFKIPGPNSTEVMVTAFLPHEIYLGLVESAGIEPYCLSPDQLSARTGLGSLMRAWGNRADMTVKHDLAEVGALGMHCNGVQYTTSMRAGGAKSIYVASFNIVSANTAALRGKRHLFFVLSKRRLCDCGCSGFHSFKVMFQVFAWSMHDLMLGQAPMCRHDGTPWTAEDQKVRLASGRQLPAAALLQIRGDWEWYTTGFRFRSAGGDPFCWKCESQKSRDLAYQNFSPADPHRRTLISHVAYMQSCFADAAQPSTISRCPDMFIDLIAMDSMHAGDLGVF